MGERIVLVTDSVHRTADIPGGVQVCTAEYIELLEAAGFDVELFEVRHTRRVWPRLKIKLGLDSYDRYDFGTLFGDLQSVVAAYDARIVALNQLALTGFAPLLKREFGERIQTVVLSHGNESGDFLHEVARPARPVGRLRRSRDTWRLGRLLYEESQMFATSVDLVLVLSETERQIDNWLGAKAVYFVPRTFRAEDIGWRPEPGRVGFVGSLDHKPNLDGLRAVLDELAPRRTDPVSVRVVGAPSAVGRTLRREYSFVDYLGPLMPAELKAEAASWALFLNPVFWYSRGASTKLSQAVNWGIPIVSTPAGNRGYIWREGTLLTVQSPSQMAEVIVALATSRDALNELAKQVRAVAQTGPAIAKIASQVKSILSRTSDR